MDVWQNHGAKTHPQTFLRPFAVRREWKGEKGRLNLRNQTTITPLNDRVTAVTPSFVSGVARGVGLKQLRVTPPTCTHLVAVLLSPSL